MEKHHTIFRVTICGRLEGMSEWYHLKNYLIYDSSASCARAEELACKLTIGKTFWFGPESNSVHRVPHEVRAEKTEIVSQTYISTEDTV